jgi:5-methylcytosine-specific restriction endonuclease McrA
LSRQSIVAVGGVFDCFSRRIRHRARNHAEWQMKALLERPVLVLNRYWQPVHTCSVRRSLHLLCNGHAQVVQVEGDEKFQAHDLISWIRHSDGHPGGDRVRSARIGLLPPRVVVLTLYDRLPRLEVRFSRRNVFLRDQFTCQYCAKVLPETQLNLDHVTPRDKGGRTTWENIVTSCFRCNTRKANKLPHEVGMHPRSKPFAPRWRPLFGLHADGAEDESWRHFIAANPAGARLSA